MFLRLALFPLFYFFGNNIKITILRLSIYTYLNSVDVHIVVIAVQIRDTKIMDSKQFIKIFESNNFCVSFIISRIDLFKYSIFLTIINCVINYLFILVCIYVFNKGMLRKKNTIFIKSRLIFIACVSYLMLGLNEQFLCSM